MAPTSPWQVGHELRGWQEVQPIHTNIGGLLQDQAEPQWTRTSLYALSRSKRSCRTSVCSSSSCEAGSACNLVIQLRTAFLPTMSGGSVLTCSSHPGE